MTLQSRFMALVSGAVAIAIVVLAALFFILVREALIRQAEAQAQVLARIVAESARLSEVSLEETQSLVTDMLTSVAITADHVEDTAPTDASERFAEIVARGNLASIWLVDRNLHVVASSIGDYGAVITGQVLPDHLSRDALESLVDGRKFAIDFGPAVDGARYVGVRAGGGMALIVGQAVSALDRVRSANGLPTLLRSLTDRNDIVSIEVVDDQMKSVAHAGAELGSAVVPKLAASAISGDAPASELRQRHLWVAAPIRDIAGIAIGAVIVQLSNARGEQLLDNFLRFGGGAALLVLALGAGLAALSARRITQPVAAMASAARAIEAGTFETASLAPIGHRSDELGHLARVFAAMAEKVQRREEDLEAEVRQRTEELQQKNTLLEEAARRVEKELAAARTLQAAMLPEALPESASYIGRAAMVPARDMSGDFYDFFPLGDRRLGLVIADVSGKGVPAAFFMAISRTVLQASAQDGASAGDCLARANAILCARNPMELFVTAFYGIVDVDSGAFTYANGGHNPPMVVRRADGSVMQLPRTGGMALGVASGIPYREATVMLAPGDTLFLYTDGISEAMDGEGRPFGEERIEAALCDAAGMPVESVLSTMTGAVSAFVAGAPQSDDITCLVVRYLGPEGMAVG